MLIEDEHYSSVLTREALRTGRATRRDDRWSVWETYGQVTDKTCKIESGNATQLLETTVSM